MDKKIKKIIIRLGDVVKYPTVILVVIVSLFEKSIEDQGLLHFSGYLLLLLAAIIGASIVVKYLNKKNNET